MSDKPTVFIGSSSEGQEVADEIGVMLERFAEVTIWSDAVFLPGRNYLQTLIDQLEKHDFAVLVFTADDMVESRGEEQRGPRDNVIFELGLFMGRLSPNRTFFVHERGAELKLPSDLAGIEPVQYDGARKDNNLTRALSAVRTTLRREIKSQGPRARAEGIGLRFLANQGEFSDEEWRSLLVDADGAFDVMGTALGGWRRTRDFREIVTEKANAGCSVRILLMHEAHPALDTILYGFEDQQSREELVSTILSNHQFFLTLAEKSPNIEVRQIRHGNAQFFVTRTDSQAVLVQYLYSSTWGHGPLWQCDKSTQLYEVARREFDHLWKVNTVK